MATQVLLKPKHNGLFDCVINDVEQSQSFSAELEEIAQRLQSLSRSVVTLLIPGLDAVYRSVEFGEKESKHLAKTIPYSLEDDLLGEVEETHMVLAKPQAQQVMVSAVETEYLESLLEQCQQQGIDINACYPEQALLGAKPWSLYCCSDVYFLVLDEQRIYALDADCLSVALANVTDQFANLPSDIRLVLLAEQDAEEVLNLLPSSLHHLLQIENSSYAELMQTGISQNKAVSFLQGIYAPVQAWAQMWQFWRGLAILTLVVLVLQIGIKTAQNQQLKDENQSLLAEQKQLVREVFPRGKVVLPKRQLENELKRLQGGTSDASFMSFLYASGQMLEQADGLEINNINYDATKGELRLDILTASFSELDKAKEALAAQGYELVLQNSNAQDEKLRARIVIKNK